MVCILPVRENIKNSFIRVRRLLLDGDNAARALHFFTDYDVVNVYEAKRKSKSLDAHVPQVIVQCLASVQTDTDSIAKVNVSVPNDQCSLQNLAFALTSGKAWIFGVVDAEKGECFQTADLKLDMTNLRAMKHSILRALTILIKIWNTQTGYLIKEGITAYFEQELSPIASQTV
ncbi:hypothetical protein H2248_000040 [Termitomyces sp. 'cryptogamus']|nr:hypothetical protein H2248_000040 [Termitomyces sp. 'cryptogamus']